MLSHTLIIVTKTAKALKIVKILIFSGVELTLSLTFDKSQLKVII